MSLSKKDKKEIDSLAKAFSDKILVKVGRSEDGGFYSEIITYPGCYTQAEGFSELIGMINDCVKTYFNVPDKYIQYMPEYLVPIEMANNFLGTSFKPKKENIELELVGQK